MSWALKLWLELSSEEWGRVNRMGTRRRGTWAEKMLMEKAEACSREREGNIVWQKDCHAGHRATVSGERRVSKWEAQTVPRASYVYWESSVGLSPPPCSHVGSLSPETAFTVSSSRLPSLDSPVLRPASPPPPCSPLLLSFPRNCQFVSLCSPLNCESLWTETECGLSLCPHCRAQGLAPSACGRNPTQCGLLFDCWYKT